MAGRGEAEGRALPRWERAGLRECRGEDSVGRTACGAGPSWSARRSGPSQGTELLFWGTGAGQSGHQEG